MASNRSLQSWLTHLESIHPLSMDFKLERIKNVLKNLNLGKIAPLIITVAGTNGKGSTSTTIASLYHAAGLRVGLFTSPHIWRFNERIRINLEEAEDQDIIAAFEAIEIARGEITLTYFEFATLAAFYLFKEKQVEVAILEVGLGGRLDSTNIIDADIAVITPIGIDHTAQLGNTIAEIAREKAGIIKPLAQVITAETAPNDSILKQVKEMDATLYQNGRDFHYQRLESGAFNYQFNEEPLLTLPAPNLKGLHQYQNAATAITALYVGAEKFKITPTQTHIANGLKDVKLEGRFQQLTRADSPTIYLDVTHNPQGAHVLKSLIADLRSEKGENFEIIALLGMLKDKDSVALAMPLKDSIQSWVTATIDDCERGQSGEALATKIQPIIQQTILVAPSIATGCQQVLEMARPQDIIIVFGSFHMMADSLNWFKENQYV
ncbi:bifunctional folylpolyglutamate synthase/dihydrofolate synthase [Ignatzschineria indica]|uniref:Dihydrofolate synthase/folylpolyglutamate synthase n=1 Tax=Ignatzschineria indica TaxID=472583 RepID=A0A2U2AK59_9GAMM|nr:folylpolyglutamate synthase/dihydrofolate synthase family protein [Ignatzschineria indica]PWD83170.1 bifunctional tetrahydrofolate synthase/dihydrofolate synthase [Ignatzschineria indica]